MASNKSGYSFATWTSFIEESQIRALLKYKVKYYFAGGKPGIIPTDIFAGIMADLSEQYKKDPKMALEDFNYGPTGGQPWFMKTLAKRLKKVRDIPIDPETEWNCVSITSGSQQALYALLDTLIDPGDVIITPCLLRTPSMAVIAPLQTLRGSMGPLRPVESGLPAAFA